MPSGAHVHEAPGGRDATTYDYDNLNRLTKVTDPAYNTTVYAYNWRDQVTQVDRRRPRCRPAVRRS